MVSPRDLERRYRAQDEFIVHEMDFSLEETNETIKSLKSSTPMPVPRIGERLMLSVRTLEVEEEEAEWNEEAEEVLPEGSGILYRVERIAHEYASLELDESAIEDYRPGYGVLTYVRITEAPIE